MTTDARRLFFALLPPAPVRARMAELQASLALPARIIPQRNLHITLAFLGQVPAERMDELYATVQGLTLPNCVLRLNRLGWFSRAGVAWLGSEQPPAELHAFQNLLSAGLGDGGFRTESRRWSPHVTLYRKMRTAFDRIPFEAIDWRIEGFSLMQSESAENGVKYHALASWPAASRDE